MKNVNQIKQHILLKMTKTMQVDIKKGRDKQVVMNYAWGVIDFRHWTKADDKALFQAVNELVTTGYLKKINSSKISFAMTAKARKAVRKYYNNQKQGAC